MNTSKRVWLAILLDALILFIGFTTANTISSTIDKNQRTALLQKAKQAALLVPASSIAKLSASPADLDLDTYKSIKQTLTAFRAYDASVRFVYILGYRPSLKTQFFYVDSEPVDSIDYSPPGQLFPDTRPEDIERYLKAEAYTDGPYRDSWGEWVSGYAPILDAQGNIVALLGIDTATSIWHQQIGFVRTVISLISALLAAVVTFIVFLINKKQRSIELLEKQNRTLAHKEGKLEQLQSMAQIGRITLYFPAQTFSFEGQVLDILSLQPGDKISIEKMLDFVHIDDKEKFSKAISEITNSDISYTWVDARLGSGQTGYRLYHIYGNIERNELLAPIRFSGIIQDITDIHSS